MDQNLIAEIQLFISGRSDIYKEQSLEDTHFTIKRSLKLLSELPIARDAIFDYFSSVFERSISNYLKSKKLPNNAIFLQKLNEDDQSIQILQEGLQSLMETQKWTPSYISQWCLTRLFKASLEHKNLDFTESCSLWLRSQAVRSVLELAGSCYQRSNEEEVQQFINNVQMLFVDNRPHFDWCVAHLTSLFPVRFVSSILRLKNMFTPSLVSQTVVFIEYLSKNGSSENNLNSLMKNIVQNALENSSNPIDSTDCIITNIIQLSFHSEMFAQIMIDVFLENIEKHPELFIQKLESHIEKHPTEYNLEQIQKIIPDLIIRTKVNGTRLLLILAEQMTKRGNTIWFDEMLEILLTCLQIYIFKNLTCPLLEEIRKDSTWSVLWKACLSDHFVVQQTAVRLILVASKGNNSIIYSKTVETLLCSSNEKGFSALMKILEHPIGTIEPANLQKTISHILQRLSIDIGCGRQSNRSHFVLNNLLMLLNSEKKQSPNLKQKRIKTALQLNLSQLILLWEILVKKQSANLEKFEMNKNVEFTKKMKLESSDDAMEIVDFEEEKEFDSKDHLVLMIKIMDNIFPVGNVNISYLIKSINLTVKIFFLSLTESSPELKLTLLNHCFSLLKKQCVNRRVIRSVALRNLLEGALFLYPNIFGAPAHINHEKKVSLINSTLLEINQRQGISLNVSRSSILHSGVVGLGVQKIKQHWSPNGLDKNIKNMFMKSIVACCSSYEDSNIESKVLLDGLCQMSHILVELVSNDVLYNGIDWPEEDFKVTMEKDLHIQRTFKNCPILWSLMGLLAAHKQPLWNCSVFLRAICASIIHHWQAKSTETVSQNNVELFFFTVKLLEILSLGQMLPSPLTYLHIVIHHLEASEIAYVLRECVWNYMIANGPCSDGIEITNQSKNPPAEHFIDPLRNTMQKKLNILGNLYHQMFLSSN